ncbi:acrosin [Manis pentadactyla]|uniref:acrosin n=1 Tax=Manis pentadactyla TaxID=143292 RepID=UPI00255C6790|nr:acrosin [Manis pentadactyla]
MWQVGRELVKMLLPTAVMVLAVSVFAREKNSCDGPCGLRFRQSSPGNVRVVGGQDAAKGAWPWVVSLQVFTAHNNRRYHACGGTLLNSHWLLTAAHCFRVNKEVYNWRLIFGTREIVYGNDKPARPPLQERYVEKIIMHERYSPRSEINDIALMKIIPPVPCGPLIGPGCLPRFRAGPPRVSQACWVAGWGFLKENARKMSPVLQEARVNIIDLGLCNATQWYNGRVHSTNVCAGYPEGHIDTCQGDSGGPLMCRDNTENTYVVVGITSWGAGCARAKRPGVYTATWPYLNWIASKIGSKALQTAQLPGPPPSAAQARPPRPPAARPSTRPPWSSQHVPQPLPPRHSPSPGARPPPCLPAPPPPAAELPRARPFAQRLQQLREALEGRSSSGAKGSNEVETTDVPERTATP